MICRGLDLIAEDTYHIDIIFQFDVCDIIYINIIYKLSVIRFAM